MGVTATASSAVRPLSHAASSRVLGCCGCVFLDGHGNIVSQTLHASVMACRRCGHSACKEHYVDNLCYGCAAEEPGFGAKRGGV